MKAVLVFKEESDYARTVLDYLRDFKRDTGKDLETLDPDTRDGTAFCGAYGIMQYPTIIAIDDSGRMVQTWAGLPLPRIMEVSYYTQ